MFSEPFSNLNSSTMVNHLLNNPNSADTMNGMNMNATPLQTNNSLFNFGHRGSVSSIPSLTSSITQSNESLRFAASNESLRMARSNDSLRMARSNESLRYSNSNESFRKANNNNNISSSNSIFNDSFNNGFVNFRMSNPIQPDSNVQKQQTFQPSTSPSNYLPLSNNDLGHVFTEQSLDYDNLLAKQLNNGSPNYQELRKSSIISLPNLGNNMGNSPFGNSMSNNPLPNNSLSTKYQYFPLESTSDQYDNELNRRLNQYSINGQYTEQPVNQHQYSQSIGAIKDYRFNGSNGAAQPPPQLRSVGSFKDLKNAIINESLVDQRVNHQPSNSVSYQQQQQQSMNAKHHYFKSQSVNLSQQMYLKDDYKLLNVDGLVNGYARTNGANVQPSNNNYTQRAANLNIDDLNFGGLYLDNDNVFANNTAAVAAAVIGSVANGNSFNSNPSPPAKNEKRPSNGRRKSDVKKEDKKTTEKEIFNKYKNIPFDQLESKILKLSTDQNGCRFLQKKLEEDFPEKPLIIATIYKQVKPNIYDLVIDPFGNYLIQKIFEYLTVVQRTELIKLCSGRFDEISLNQHGTRALQKMIEYITTQEQTDYVVKNLAHHVVRLIKDLNGNHVIQKCLYKFDPINCQFIIDGICESISEVATHRHGCCVLQKCLDRSNEAQFLKLGHEILSNGLVLMQDPFGNYVIQYLLPRKQHELNPNFAEIIGKQIIGKLEDLSIQKFASNVVEKCLKCLNDPVLRDILVEEILNFNNLESVLKDHYGNYVVQTALEVATGDLRITAINKIAALMPFVKNTPYARKIQQRLAEAEIEAKKELAQQGV